MYALYYLALLYGSKDIYILLHYMYILYVITYIPYNDDSVSFK